MSVCLQAKRLGCLWNHSRTVTYYTYFRHQQAAGHQHVCCTPDTGCYGLNELSQLFVSSNAEHDAGQLNNASAV